MSKEIVLITGASGFIGTALIERLINDYSIIGIDKVLHKDRNSKVIWFKADISNRKLLNGVFEKIKKKFNGNVDYVFHLAAYYDLSNRKSNRYRETNENGTKYLLDNLVNLNVKEFVFASSTAVVKPVETNEILNEESELGAELYYGNSKIASEKIILDYKEKIKVTIVRLAAVYSHDCRLLPLANQIAFVWKRGFGYRYFPGKGEGGLSYIHIDDVTDAFNKAMLLSKDISSGHIFILSEEEYVSNNVLFSLIFHEIYGKQSSLIHLSKWIVRALIYAKNMICYLSGKDYFFKPWMVNIADKKYRFDIAKAKGALKWQPRYLLKEFIPVIIQGLKRAPGDWFKINDVV